jgi:nickel superoxide dismutase
MRNAIKRLFPTRVAHAHCDIPCGIYDPISAKIAAQTVLKMVARINALAMPSRDDGADAAAAYANTVSRYVTVKEHHADVCKKELDILWHDYFRPDHLETYPDLHTTVWQANKLASSNKQSVDLDAARQLVDSVDKIAEIFWATKGVEYSDPVAEVRFGT